VVESQSADDDAPPVRRALLLPAGASPPEQTREVRTRRARSHLQKGGSRWCPSEPASRPVDAPRSTTPRRRRESPAPFTDEAPRLTTSAARLRGSTSSFPRPPITPQRPRAEPEQRPRPPMGRRSRKVRLGPAPALRAPANRHPLKPAAAALERGPNPPDSGIRHPGFNNPGPRCLFFFLFWWVCVYFCFVLGFFFGVFFLVFFFFFVVFCSFLLSGVCCLFFFFVVMCLVVFVIFLSWLLCWFFLVCFLCLVCFVFCFLFLRCWGCLSFWVFC